MAIIIDSFVFSSFDIIYTTSLILLIILFLTFLGFYSVIKTTSELYLILALKQKTDLFWVGFTTGSAQVK